MSKLNVKPLVVIAGHKTSVSVETGALIRITRNEAVEHCVGKQIESA